MFANLIHSKESAKKEEEEEEGEIIKGIVNKSIILKIFFFYTGSITEKILLEEVCIYVKVRYDHELKS